MGATACAKKILDCKQQAVGTLGLAACQLSTGLLALSEEDEGTLRERRAIKATIQSITAIEVELAKTLPSTTKRFTEAAMVGAVPEEGIDPPIALEPPEVE